MKTSNPTFNALRNFAVLLVAQVAFAAEPAPVPPQAAVPDRLADTRGRDVLDRDRLAVLAKTFCVKMRQHHRDKNANALREYFDPRYLRQHGLTERDLAVELLPVRSIHNLIIGDDWRTALCVVDTEGDATLQFFVLRATVSEEGMFLMPANPPDAATGRITPWVIRTISPAAAARPAAVQPTGPVPTAPVGKWKVQFTNGVKEACTFGNGTAVVEEPLRQSRGAVVVQSGAIVIPCEDDRTERWTPVGDHFVVEHWFPSAQYPSAPAVLGIAIRNP